MKWLSGKTKSCSDERIQKSKETEKKAKASYDRMMKSLHDLEDLLQNDTDRRPDSKRG